MGLGVAGPRGCPSPGSGGVPGGSPPPPPPPSRGLQWKPRGGGSRPHEGSEFPQPLSGPVNFSCSLVPFAPRGCVRVHSVWQPPARVCAQRSRAYLPRGVWKPMWVRTPRGVQGLVESGVCIKARVGRGLFAAPACVCACFCTEMSSVDEMLR